MRLGTWESYATPPKLAQELVTGIRMQAPANAVDICAGSGNLLSAVRDRWTSTKLRGSDVKSAPSASGFAWNKMDGRCFALNTVGRGLGFDLVVANPPFGDAPPHLKPLSNVLLGENGKQLLRSRRIELSMTLAAGMLVRDGGVLATIIPETIVTGPSYIELRKWLASRFYRFDIQPIERGRFKNQDLGLVFLTAYRKTNSIGVGKRAFIGSCRGADNDFNIQRGILVSSETSSRGGTAVVHCGGVNSLKGYEMRRCTQKVGTRKNQIVVASGDVIVVRVGRNAGFVSLFEDENDAIATDCIFVLRPSSRVTSSALRRIVTSGALMRRLSELAGGLGPKFIRRSDLERELSLVLSDSP